MCVHLRIPRSCESRFVKGQAGSRSQYHCSSESRHITIRETVFGPRHISIDNDNWDPSQASSAMGMRSSGHVFRRALLASILSHVLFSFPSSLFRFAVYCTSTPQPSRLKLQLYRKHTHTTLVYPVSLHSPSAMAPKVSRSKNLSVLLDMILSLAERRAIQD